MACTQTLAGLINDCAKSMGGIKAVALVERDKVAAITVATGNVTAITMGQDGGGNDYVFFKYYFRPESGSMTSTMNIDNATGVNYVSTELVLQFARMDTVKRTEMCAMVLNELYALVQDCNNKWWLLGYDNPIYASAGDGQTGQARGDGNRYQITLTDNSEDLPYEVEATAAEAVM